MAMRPVLRLVEQLLDLIKASGVSNVDATAALGAARNLLTVEPEPPVTPAAETRAARKTV